MRKICAVFAGVAAFWCVFSGTATCRGAGFLHANGVTNLDVNGQPILLKGVDLGCWLWPEYYMMGSPNMSAYANAGTGSGGIANYYDGLVAAIEDVLGDDTNLTAQVLDAYWTDYITPADISFLHANGFNSVRVPYSFEEFFCVTNWANNYPTNGYDISTGFKYLDNLLASCASNWIYVIPDMHCSPGGPNNFSVTNYGGSLNTNTASVFANGPNLALAEHIWARIAARYATNSWLGGYDLLNEPVNTSVAGGQVGSPILGNTYSNLAQVIRAVDTNHLLFCEGDVYASQLWDVTNAGWRDAHRSYSDHDYGSTLPLSTGNRALCVGANTPDWAGEFGINSTHWYNQIFFNTYQLPITLTDNGRTATITEGACFWAYKISGQCYGLVQNPQTPGWNALKAYWASPSTAAKPLVTNAYTWLMAYAQGTLFSNCVVHPEIMDSFRRAPHVYTIVSAAYKPGSTLPGRIFAVDYDMGDEGVAYNDTVFDDEANEGPSGTAWNNGWFGRDDGVDTTSCDDPGELLKVGWNDAGEWQRHTVDCTPGLYNVYIRYGSGASGGQIDVSLLKLNAVNNSIISSNDLTGAVTLPTTGGYAAYATYAVSNVTVTDSGTATLQISCVSPGYDLVWVEMSPADGPPLAPAGDLVAGAQPGVPAALTAALACVAGTGEISLNWPPCDNANSYRVQRSGTSGGPYTTVAVCAAPSYTDTGLTNGVPCFYVVAAANAIGSSGYSAEVSATPQAGSLPAGWMDQDVGVATLWDGSAGDVGFPGSASFNGNVYTVNGSGIDVWGNADSFHFADKPVSADFTNIVRVATLGDTDPWAKAGIMLRESFNQDAANVFICVSAQNGVLLSYRAATSGSTSANTGPNLAAPLWLKLVRIQNGVTGFTSTDGLTWTEVGSTISTTMASNAFVGLAVTSHNNLAVSAATFNNVSVVSAPPPAPLGLNAFGSNNLIALNWMATPGATDYIIKRALTNGGPYLTIAADVLSTNYVDTTITNGVLYDYVVSAENWNGEGPDSGPATAMAPLPSIIGVWQNGGVLLSWPLTANSFKLFGTSNLAPPVSWMVVTNGVATQNGVISVSLPATNDDCFFRLMAP